MVAERSSAITQFQSLLKNGFTARSWQRGPWRLLLIVAVFGFLAAPLALDFTGAREVSKSRSNASDFTQAKFKKAQKDGRLILVETYADWCAPCQIQAPIVKRLRKEKRFRGLVLLRVNERTPRKVWKDLRLSGYGQFVVFRGNKEVGRGSPLNEAQMRALLAR